MCHVIPVNYDDDDLVTMLDAGDAKTLDDAAFGIIVMNETGFVQSYNRYESALSGLSSDFVVGKHFFTAVAPCTNNFLVAQRFEDETPLDAVLDYVFTLKMRPTKVKLRLLKSAVTRRHYLLVVRR